MSDLVERLREDAMRDRVTVYSAKEITEIADEIERQCARIAHLERVQRAADDFFLVHDEGDMPVSERECRAAYDAVRKGEG